MRLSEDSRGLAATQQCDNSEEVWRCITSDECWSVMWKIGEEKENGGARGNDDMETERH